MNDVYSGDDFLLCEKS